MMPVIRPIPIPPQPETEYRAERRAFAEMQAELHGRAPAGLLRRLWRALGVPP